MLQDCSSAPGNSYWTDDIFRDKKKTLTTKKDIKLKKKTQLSLTTSIKINPLSNFVIII